MATLLSYVGGPTSGANLKSVTLFREIPDDDGKIVYNLSFTNFLNNGDRSDFVKIKPKGIDPLKYEKEVTNKISIIN